MKLVLYGVNLLETAVVTVSGEAVGKPKALLYDREITEPWQDTSNAGTRILKSFQGSGVQALDSVVGAPGHNLAGATLSWESSPDDAAWTVRGTLVVPSAAIFRIRGATPWTTAYSRLTITGAAAAPSLAELLFSLAWVAPREVSEPSSSQGLVPNTRLFRASSGKAWGSQRGEPRWHAEYLIRDIPQVDRVALEQVYRDLGGGADPLFLEDADGTARWARWLNNPMFEAVPVYSHDVRLEFEEEL